MSKIIDPDNTKFNDRPCEPMPSESLRDVLCVYAHAMYNLGEELRTAMCEINTWRERCVRLEAEIEELRRRLQPIHIRVNQEDFDFTV